MKLGLDKEQLSVFEIIGIFVVIVAFFILLCIPGCQMSNMKRNQIRNECQHELINDLCNKSNGQYDFCHLDKTTYSYSLKEGYKTND